MKKASIVSFLVITILFVLACGAPAILSTPTPTATNTQVPTPTETLAPTATPTPVLIPGVNSPMKYVGVEFTVTEVVLTGSWDIEGETNYPTAAGDIFLVVIFKVNGDLSTVPLPQTEDSERTYHIKDNFDRVDQWAYINPVEDPTVLSILFVVDGSARDYSFFFPNGQEISLTPFLK